MGPITIKTTIKFCATKIVLNAIILREPYRILSSYWSNSLSRSLGILLSQKGRRL
jgi:hypothetical protein